MRTRFPSLVVALFLTLAPAPAHAQDDTVRAAVDALVELVSTGEEAALGDYADRRLAPAYLDRLGRDGALDLLADVREATRGTLGSIDVGMVDGRLVLTLSADRTAELGLQLDPEGLVTHLEVLSTGDTPARPASEMDAVVERRMLAIEGLPTTGTEGFAEEHFTPSLRAALDPAHLVTMLDQTREAAASAGMISIDRAPEGFVLSFRGGRIDLDVVFGVEGVAPYRIATFDVAVVDDAPTGPPVRTLRWDELEQRLDEAHRGGMSGTVLAIRDGTTVLDRSYGLADRAAGRAGDAATIYAIGSIPIDFTRAGVLLLVQRGEVQLDDPISRYFPAVPDDKRALTVRHLLSHESGLPNFHHRPEVDADFDLTWIDRDEAERRILGTDLLFAPGEDRQPSHSAYGLLAALIERVSGQPYQEFMRTNFFDPLDMDVTGPFGDDLDQPRERFATGYGTSTVGEPNIPPHWGPTSWLVQGSGGMVSNPADMRRWFEGMREGRILRGEMLEEYLERGSALGASDRGFFFGHFWAGGDDMIFLAINGGSDSDDVQELVRALQALVGANEVTTR